jgi:DNA-binding NarL/FixJ family response regulator
MLGFMVAARDSNVKNIAETMRILIADDHSIARSGLKTFINSQLDMWVVAEAVTGTQAVELHRVYRPDVTLMDVRMPRMNGLDAIATIRVEAPDARIIAVSMYGTDEDICHALSVGACAYLTKDILHDQLIRAIRLAYSGRKIIPRS